MLRLAVVTDVQSASAAHSAGNAEGEAKQEVVHHLGAYELLLELASGGMATVWLARANDRRRGPPLVAIKRPHRHLANDKIFLTMLVDEARLASAIHHPNVVKVRELGFEAGAPFIVMDYIEGASLAELRRELGASRRALDVRVALRIVLDALEGLHAAHALEDESGRRLNIVHRDVSPHNILIGCDGASRLTDFGVAKAEDRIQTTRTHEVKGKLAYMAPERVDKRRMCTVQSDVFSMAVVLWECFAGRRLFRGEAAVDVLQEVMNAPIPTLRQIGAAIPPALDDVLARALSRNLETRYATASEFAQAIQRAVVPEECGAAADVARLMEAVFAARMAARQEHVREAIGRARLADLLNAAGLPTREVRDGDTSPVAFPDDLAPPAPSDRYMVGVPLSARPALRMARKASWTLLGIIGGALAGAVLTLALVSGRHKAPGIVESRVPSLAASSEADARRLLVPLPFLATRVVLDDQERAVEPPADVVPFELTPSSGTTHWLTAVARDGSTAEGYVREENGVARAEGEGLVVRRGVPGDEIHKASRPNRPPTVRNGFTRLP